jgi:hypothetical protein
MSRALLAAAACVLAGCAAQSATRCAPHEQPAINEFIYFGTRTPDGVVTDEQWASFLADVVTPRFPQGLTTWRASGQWRSQDGRLAHEDSHVLNLVHPADDAQEKAIQELIGEYRHRFRQEAVLRVKSASCSSL